MGLFDAVPRPVKTYHSEPYDRISPTKTTFEAAGKTVLVTGGAAGIGFEISKAFAEAGVARLIILSRSSGPQIEAKKKLHADFPKLEIELVQAAITDNARMKEVLTSVGPIDVLVLNAAATHPSDVATIDLKDGVMEDVFTTNVLGPWNIVKTYLSLPAPPSGTRTVLNVSSGALHLYMPRNGGYGASKAAFTQMMSFLADEYSPEKDGIRLLSFHPGAFLTSMARSVGFDENSFGGNWEDICLPGHFAVWLASREADFLHGRFVWSHWDVDELIAQKQKFEQDPNFLRIGLTL